MQICQNFTQRSKSMQNDAQKCNFKQKNIDAEYFYDIVWRDFARWVIFTGQQPAAKPLADARGTLGFHGTPVENHCYTVFELRLPTPSKWHDLRPRNFARRSV